MIQLGKVSRTMIKPADFCRFCEEHRKQVVGNRLNIERLDFFYNYVYPPDHNRLLAVRQSKKERAALAHSLSTDDVTDDQSRIIGRALILAQLVVLHHRCSRRCAKCGVRVKISPHQEHPCSSSRLAGSWQDEGAWEFPDLASAQKHFPELDPYQSTTTFTCAMRGEVNDQPALRFETWSAYEVLQGQKCEAFFFHYRLLQEEREHSEGGNIFHVEKNASLLAGEKPSSPSFVGRMSFGRPFLGKFFTRRAYLRLQC